MFTDYQQVRVGMPVVGADEEPVGIVKTVDHVASLVARPLQRDVYVPHFAQPRVEGDRLILRPSNFYMPTTRANLH